MTPSPHQRWLGNPWTTHVFLAGKIIKPVMFQPCDGLPEADNNLTRLAVSKKQKNPITTAPPRLFLQKRTSATGKTRKKHHLLAPGPISWWSSMKPHISINKNLPFQTVPPKLRSCSLRRLQTTPVMWTLWKIGMAYVVAASITYRIYDYIYHML